MKIRIYQIDLDLDINRLAFLPYEYIQTKQNSPAVDAEIYRRVYEGSIEANNLEDVYRIFNIDRPKDYKGRSLSVSDVVEIVGAESKESGFYYCDSIGFRKIEFDAGAVKVFAEEEKILKVVLVEPGKSARAAEIGADLKSLQETVNGYIERCCPFDDNAYIICNEEGKLHGVPNRAVRDRAGNILDIIFGTFFVCSAGEEDFTSLSEEQIARYTDLFKTPELIAVHDGEIIIIPFPNSEHKEEGR